MGFSAEYGYYDICLKKKQLVGTNKKKIHNLNWIPLHAVQRS